MTKLSKGSDDGAEGNPVGSGSGAAKQRVGGFVAVEAIAADNGTGQIGPLLERVELYALYGIGSTGSPQPLENFRPGKCDHRVHDAGGRLGRPVSLTCCAHKYLLMSCIQS